MLERRFEASIPPDACYLNALRGFFGAILEDYYRDRAEELLLALGEACMNIIQHRGASMDSEPISVVAELGPELARFRIGRYCRLEDVSSIKPRELDDVRPGGLGTHFIDQIMDRIEYEPERDSPSCCALVLEKRFPVQSDG